MKPNKLKPESPQLRTYLKLETRLKKCTKQIEKLNAQYEDLQAKMDPVWYRLTDKEMMWLDAQWEADEEGQGNNGDS